MLCLIHWLSIIRSTFKKSQRDERGKKKKSHFNTNDDKKFLVVFCLVTPERQSTVLATRSLLCSGTEGHDLVVDLVLLGL